MKDNTKKKYVKQQKFTISNPDFFAGGGGGEEEYRAFFVMLRHFCIMTKFKCLLPKDKKLFEWKLSTYFHAFIHADFLHPFFSSNISYFQHHFYATGTLHP